MTFSYCCESITSIHVLLFILFNWNSYPLNESSPFSFPHPLAATVLLFCLWVWSRILQYAPFGIAYFNQHNVLKVHPCCSMCQNIPLCVFTILFFHLSADGYLGCSSTFGLWWIMLLWQWLCRISSGSTCSYLGYMPKSGIAGSYGSVQFSTVAQSCPTLQPHGL